MTCSDFFGDTFCTVIIDGGSFLWGLVKFIVFGFKTCLNLLWKAFTYIFSPELFNNISDTFNTLSTFIGAPSAFALTGLFVFSFIMLFMSFIFRLLKGQVQHNTTLKKLHYDKKK